MTRLRRALPSIAIVSLLCQAATLSLAPVVLWSFSAEKLLECTCAHGDHAICPMHHTPVPGSKLCLMRGTDDSGTAVLTSVLGGLGLVPLVAQVAVPVTGHRILVTDIRTISLRPATPDPPPPRA